MSDAATITQAAPASTASKKTKGKSATASKKPKVKPSHPKTSDMVTAAIKNLRERGGSSLQAIKKYISGNYKVDADKMAPFIRKYLKSAVTTGSLVQTKGKGASGSFKLSGGAAEKVSKSKATTAKKANPPSAKTAAKKSAVSVITAAKPKAAKPAPSKAKKTTKAPTKKPKAPKPKKAAPKKK